MRAKSPGALYDGQKAFDAPLPAASARRQPSAHKE
jgi:hypothetical protein